MDNLYLIFMCLPFVLCVELRNEGIIFNYNNTYKYNVLYTIQLNKKVEYVMEFAGDIDGYDTPARVTVSSDLTNRTYPLFVTARQQKGVFSWQLPMIVQTPNSLELFTNISRTLCPHNNLFDEHEDTCDITPQNIPTVHLTTSSPDNISVTIIVETVEDFYINLNEYTNLSITPSQPRYYFYPFKQQPKQVIDLKFQSVMRKFMCNHKLNSLEKFKLSEYVKSMQLKSGSGGDDPFKLFSSKSVIVEIESDSDVCALVSIQNFSCPVFDNERDILYDGYYLTMTRRGGITLTQDVFPVGFYVVFIVKSSDEDCIAKNTASNQTLPRMAEYLGWSDTYEAEVIINDGRVKNFRFKIVQTISYREYIVAAGAALGFFMFFYLAFLVAIIFNKSKKSTSTTESMTNSNESEESPRSSEIDDTNGNTRRRTNTRQIEVSIESTSRQNLIEANTPTAAGSDSCSDSDSDDSASGNAATDGNGYNPADKRLCVADLAKKRPRVLTARSKMYLWNVLIVTVFYTLPVIQLVVTYQRMLNQSGNQDLCYFNFLCAHPLMSLSDFNHVYSNIGYVSLGALFLLQVWRKHNRYRQKTPAEKKLGIPQHFGLLYAMGIALVSEGLLSAAYHVCPNSMNFQFDTSFMYVTSVLCMVKIYQNRHPDINARAHATFGVLALIIFIGLVGVLNANFYFWVAFTILHLVTCLVMTFQIYYLGRFRLDGAVVYNAASQLVRRPLAAITPTYCGRMVLLFIANLANWTIAAYGVSQHTRDFASHLLLILMSNLFLYTLFYIVMKLLHKESIRWYSWTFIALTYISWFVSGYFYLDQSTNWSLTPAQSRNSNKFCSLLQLYDSHDIWHFLSSIAMFFSFNMYLTIDDNLSKMFREDIMAF